MLGWGVCDSVGSVWCLWGDECSGGDLCFGIVVGFGSRGENMT